MTTNKNKSKGLCFLCGKSYSKSGMNTHLKSCIKKNINDKSSKDEQLDLALHILIQGFYASDYWMNLQVPDLLTLSDLDNFLRDTWLECCGHMSAFTIDDQHFAKPADTGFGDLDMEEIFIEQLSEARDTFTYDYDFGSTTRLKLKVVDKYYVNYDSDNPTIKILAGNHPPDYRCDCENSAEFIDLEKMYGDTNPFLCSDCIKGDEDMILPVVNSPRIGECGYAGPGLILPL